MVAKIIANRLNPIPEKLISPNQRAFMKGRWIAENTVIAQEVVHKVKKQSGKRRLMILKIDMKKAFDSMELPFIIRLLDAWGFEEHFQQLIQSCMSSVTFNLLLNGSISKQINPNRGLRQKDHISPLLFIVGLEVLTRLLG